VTRRHSNKRFRYFASLALILPRNRAANDTRDQPDCIAKTVETIATDPKATIPEGRTARPTRVLKDERG
jgi:hypothetical protein